MRTPIDHLKALARQRRQSLIHSRQALSPQLPPRWWRQQAHLTVPVGMPARALKALESPGASALRFLQGLDIDAPRLAQALQLPLSAVQAAWSDSIRAPLVLLDAEDAQAPDAALAGRLAARQVLDTYRQSPPLDQPLCVYRPAALLDPACVDDLFDVLSASLDGRGSSLIHAVSWAKATRPDEVRWLADQLEQLESLLGLPLGTWRIQLLVESSRAALDTLRIAEAAGPRLCGIVYGATDHAADARLHGPPGAHPLAHAARLAIVDAAAACQVPAIDSMTVRYPVTDKNLSHAENARNVLEALRSCAEDARLGFGLGMSGKWVGHPTQLLVVLACAHAQIDPAHLATELARVRAYAQAVQQGVGALLIDGVMTDRANDRQSRAYLQRALSWGALSPAEVQDLGIG